MKRTRTSWGFDTKDIDTNVRPQDDFYHYAAGNWLRRNPIPPTESRWGSFTILRYETERQLHAILNELDNKRSLPVGSPERLIRDFFRSGMDMKRRNALGIKPVTPFLKSVAAITSLEEIVAFLPELHRIGIGVFFGAGVDQDSKDSTKYILHLHQDGLGLPDRDYYLKDDAESVRVRTAYQKHVEAVFKLLKYAPLEAKKASRSILALETRLAKASMRKEDKRDAEKTYHKKTPKDLQRLSPAIKWKSYLEAIGAKNPKAVIAMQPEFLRAVSSILKTTSIEDLKAYLTFHGVNDYASYLSHAFVKQNFSFYGTTLSGMKEMKPLWRRVLAAVNGSLGELLGRIYVKKHFPPEAKRAMNRVVDDLFEAYEARLKNLDWMSAATKRKALRKLHSMNRKIGYPDRWKSYGGLSIRADDYLGNAVRSATFEHMREMRKLGKPIDRKEWFMFPQTVNAYFAPNLNDIVFPAAILQPPYFDLTADDALNYGAIGMVIGHEITHGFDDDGSKFDHRGNLKSWWTKTDKKRFEKHAKIIEQQYNGYSVADGVKVNGKLTLGENIADLGGIAIALDAYKLRMKRTGRKVIDQLSPEQRFFLSLTLFERENCRPEFQKLIVLTDPHSPSKCRINGPLANINEFYEAYNVQAGDKLYRKPSIRTTVW